MSEEFGRLDREIGITYCGDEELYEEILHDFYLLIDTKSEKIESLRTEGNIHDYVIEVHALKSTARMIGATALSELALELEMAGKADNVDLINEKTELLLKMYRAYKETLSYFDGGNSNEGLSESSNSEIKDILNAMREASEDFDMDKVDELMAKLMGISMPTDELSQKRKQLNLYVRDVAFDEVKELCLEMANAL